MIFSVVIVNWKVRDLLKKCLESIAKHGKKGEFEVIVVDNNSQDGSIEMMRTNFSDCVCVANLKNLGFAAAVNQGIKQARGEYVVLLNPDVEMESGAFDGILKEFKNNPETGIVGGKIKNKDGLIQPSVRAFPDVLSQILINLKLHHLIPSKAYRRYMMNGFDYGKRQEVDQIMGAFFVIRRKVIDKIGLMDERFFVWFEEVDFCKRAKDAGWKIIYNPEIQALHRGGKSFSQISSAKRQMIFNKSLRRYMMKHYGIAAWLVFIIIFPASIALAIVSGLFHPGLSAYD